MAADRKDDFAKARRSQEMIAAGIEDRIDAVAVYDVRGTRYPHVLNHLNIYTIPSIDEILNLYHESSSPHESALESGAIKQQPGTGPSCVNIATSIANGYVGSSSPQRGATGVQLYNVRTAVPPDLRAPSDASTQSPSDRGDVPRHDSWDSASSISEEDGVVYLSTIPEEAEPPDLEPDVCTTRTDVKEHKAKRATIDAPVRRSA